jgi:hypothetical protein
MTVETRRVQIEPSEVVLMLAGEHEGSGEAVVVEIGADVASFEPGECVDLCGDPCIDPHWQKWSNGEATLVRVPLAEYNVFPHIATYSDRVRRSTPDIAGARE